MATKKYVSKPALLALAGATVVLPSLYLLNKSKSLNSKSLIGLALSTAVYVGIIALVTIPITKKFNV